MLALEKMAKMRVYLIVFLLSFSAQLFIAIKWENTSGDWTGYEVVAENIYEGHGVSLDRAPPYRPHFGGNSFPGYPTFAALTWKVLGKSYFNLRLTQCLFFAFCVAVFAFALDRVFAGLRIGTWTGFLTALSPLSLAWNRSLHPQGLSMAVTMLLFSALFLSLGTRKIRSIAIAIAVTMGIYFRTDGILMCVPVLSILFLHNVPWKKRVLKFGLIALLLLASVGGWFVRNELVGLDKNYPSYIIMFSQDGEVYDTPKGYVLWGWTWMSKEYERGGWGYPIAPLGYEHITIAEAAYDNADEKARVQALLEELKSYSGQGFPAHIDKAFHEIALEKIRRDPLKVFVILPLKRVIALWFHPGSSAGWPFQMNELTYEQRIRFEMNYFHAALELIRVNPFAVIGKITVFAVMSFVQIFGLIGLAFLLRSECKPLGIAIAFYASAMTLFYAFSNNVESRYMSQLNPLLQFLTVYAFFALRDRYGVKRAAL